MKIIFLDFDGVLNNDAHFQRMRADRTIADIAEDTESFDPIAIAALNAIIRRSGAKVVISSSWRRMFDLDTIRVILTRHGFEGEIIGATPRLFRTPDGEPRFRGHEIQAWIDAQPTSPDAFIILDDDAEMVHLTPHLIKTDFTTGLTPDHIPPALALLTP